MNEKTALVLGGARSGKSSFAEQLALESGLDVVYVATSEIKDAEMALRVKKHKAQRPSHWYTLEEPLNPEEKLEDLVEPEKIILLDCLTIWVSNLLLHPELPFKGANYEQKEEFITDKVEKLINLLEKNNIAGLLVANEVGWGIVPDNPLARVYRDIAGRVNQFCAQRVPNVYLTVAGIPVELKQIAAKLRG